MIESCNHDQYGLYRPYSTDVFSQKKQKKNNITKTTCNSGYLGSQVDEERSELR